MKKIVICILCMLFGMISGCGRFYIVVDSEEPMATPIVTPVKQPQIMLNEKLVSINANGSILQLPESNVAISESNSFGIAFELVYTMSSTSHYNIYRSLDGGITWELIVEDFTKEIADFSYIDVVDKNTIFCYFEMSGVTEKQSVYVSEDGGMTWVPTSVLTSTPTPTVIPTPTNLPVVLAPQYVLHTPQKNLSSEDIEMLRAYVTVLEGLYYDEELPENDVEVEFMYTTYNDLFAICDIDSDGKDELYISHIATYNAGMFSVIYGYDEGKLHRELLADTLLAFYDNGVMIQKAMHNHGMAAGEDSDFWPYSLYQYDNGTDSYISIANVEAWDKSYIETDWEGNAFPDEVDMDGDGRVYYVMPGEKYERNEPMDNVAYQDWYASYMEGATARYKLPAVDLNKESIEELEELLNDRDLLTLLKSNYDKQIPSSAASPYVLQADSLSGMIVFGTGETTLIYITKDGGVTWEQMEIPPAGKTWHAVVTCATAISATEYCIGYRYWGEYDGTSFYLTTDCGDTWTRLAPEMAIPEEITSNMRYAEAKDVIYLEDKLQVQVSCKTTTYPPWSIEVKLESTDMGKTWTVVETWEQETDKE